MSADSLRRSRGPERAVRSAAFFQSAATVTAALAQAGELAGVAPRWTAFFVAYITLALTLAILMI